MAPCIAANQIPNLLNGYFNALNDLSCTRILAIGIAGGNLFDSVNLVTWIHGKKKWRRLTAPNKSFPSAPVLFPMGPC